MARLFGRFGVGRVDPDDELSVVEHLTELRTRLFVAVLTLAAAFAVLYVFNAWLLDVLLEVPIESAASRFSVRPRFGRLGLREVTALSFTSSTGVERVFRFDGDPGVVPLDPRWHQSLLRFLRQGFEHVLDGADHLLFLLCLVVPFRRDVRALVWIVTAFTAGHSVTLLSAAYGAAPAALWFPPLVETLIAATIVYMALENIMGSSISRRWVAAFAFGLIHGFGFSFALKETLQFAGDHLVVSLVAFNVGVEIGQLCVLLVAIPALAWFFRQAAAEKIGVIILSALVAHTAWHWMTERGAQLAKFPFPVLDAAFAASLMRGAMALIILAAIVWAAQGLINRWIGPRPADEPRA